MVTNRVTSTLDYPPLHHDLDYRRLRATKTLDCSRCASSKPPKIVTAIAKMQLQSECGLFLLPLEIREMIYGYVFVAKEPASQYYGMTISEAQSAEPASDLLRTCQVIFQEAHDTFEVERTAFWTKNIFYIYLRPSPVLSRLSRPSLDELAKTRSPARDSVNQLHDRELQRIQKVIIKWRTSYGAIYTLRLSSCCRSDDGVHKEDWISCYGSGPIHLAGYTTVRPGRWEKPERLVSMLRFLSATFCVE
jgi:hypothetical protein